VYLYIQAENEVALFESQVPTIVALTKGCKSIKVIRDIKDIPAGCGSAVLTPTIAVHALVRVSSTEECQCVTS
jgi:valyl-tRNA synthetase